MAFILSLIVKQIDQNSDAVQFVKDKYSPFCQS